MSMAREHRFVKDIVHGDRIFGVYALQSVTAGVTRDDKPYGDFILSDMSGKILLKFWDVKEETVNSFRNDPFVAIYDVKAVYSEKYKMQLVIDNKNPNAYIDSLSTEEIKELDNSLYQAISPIPIAELEKRLDALVESVEDRTLRFIVHTLLDAGSDIGQRYRNWPAAKDNHHKFRHGLLHHSLEVTELALADCDVLARYGHRPLYKDLVIAAALLHDIGKVDEFERVVPGVGWKYGTNASLLGHIVQGNDLILKVIAVAQRRLGADYDEQMVANLRHMIASHHMKEEWGSPVPPCFAEAFALASADGRSANYVYYFQPEADAIERGMTDEVVPQPYSNKVKRIYTGVARYGTARSKDDGSDTGDVFSDF